jgi:hypothetical protein
MFTKELKTRCTTIALTGRPQQKDVPTDLAQEFELARL